ncbi:MAG TPA: TOBE domain-containing protein [Fibrobacteraceae bacterium]|nr:TOBE domain-containing protein [Fibrobacteraceae bacterium]
MKVQPQIELDLSLVSASGRLPSDRMALLRGIRRHGTLMDASRELGISYKTACSWIEAMNNAADGPLLESRHGGADRGSTRLTSLGLAYLERYERMMALHQRMQSELDALGENEKEDFPGFLQRLNLRTSARNHLHGRVGKIEGDQVRCQVEVNLGDASVFAQISRASLREMGLGPGVRLAAVFKAASVILEPISAISHPPPINCWEGTVNAAHADGDSVEVTLSIAMGRTVAALVDQSRWGEIEKVSPQRAIALVNPAHILLLRTG